MIVVDNGSTDGSPRAAARRVPVGAGDRARPQHRLRVRLQPRRRGGRRRRPGRAGQHRRGAGGRLARADGRRARGRAGAASRGLQDGRPGRPGRRSTTPGDVLRRDGACRAARPLPARRRPLGRARRGVRGLRGRRALPARRVPGRAAASTSASSPTWRTSTWACGCAAPGWTCRYEPRAVARHAGGGTSGRLGDAAAALGGAQHAAAGGQGVPAALAAARGLPPAGLGLARGARTGAWARSCAARRRRCRCCRATCCASGPRLQARARACRSTRSCPTQPIRGPRALGYEASRSSTR